jgi:GNAT superfamily N-acetyltransferase
MVESLGSITLKSGERVAAAAVRGPDAAWRERITRLLGHKGEPWLWQNSELLSRETGIDAWFYVLHRDGVPFAHQMSADLQGVGIFGHVWTEPADRGQGAAGELLRLQLAHFRARGGRALYLSTGYDSAPYHLYQKHGFVGIAAGSGYMTWSHVPLAAFEQDYFAPGPTSLEGIDWPHWPTAPALFTADLPGIVRCAPLNLHGRSSTEEALLPWIQGRTATPHRGQVFVLRKPNGAVVALAAWTLSASNPGTLSVDVFCHPNFGADAENLLRHTLAGAPPLPAVALTDTDDLPKAAVLQALGFKPAGRHPDGWPIYRHDA